MTSLMIRIIKKIPNIPAVAEPKVINSFQIREAALFRETTSFIILFYLFLV